jgi:hypothetical protein
LNRPLPLRPLGDSDSITEGEWRFFLDEPMSREEAFATRNRDDVPSDWWTDYRLNCDTAFKHLGPPDARDYADRWPGYASRLWFDHADALLAAYTAPYPGCRPSTWWRFSAPEEARPGEATWEYLDRLDLWLDGERERAAGLFGPLRRRRETCKTPLNPWWDRRGSPRPRRD